MYPLKNTLHHNQRVILNHSSLEENTADLVQGKQLQLTSFRLG